MKKKIVGLLLILLVLVAFDLTQFSTNWQMLSLMIPLFRLPRLLVVLAAAVALSVAGLIIQTVTENPLADSGTIGVTSGASFGAVCFLLIVNALHLRGLWNFAYPIFALLGALLAFALIYLLALRQNLSPVKVLLTGIAITAFFQALIMIAQLSVNSFDFQKVAVWLSGDVWQTNGAYVAVLLVLLLIALGFLPGFMRRMEVLALGEEVALTLGLDVRKTKMQLYGLALFFAAIGVLLVGGLAFVGLIAPHIARELVGFKAKYRLWAAGLSGMIILVLADLVAQLLIAPSSLPLGFVVAFIGAPYYIYLIQKV